MTVLQTLYRRHVKFDPANQIHRAAYWRLRTTGQQDPELRFLLEEGFSNVLSMMQTRIADHFSKPQGEVVKLSERRKK